MSEPTRNDLERMLRMAENFRRELAEVESIFEDSLHKTVKAWALARGEYVHGRIMRWTSDSETISAITEDSDGDTYEKSIPTSLLLDCMTNRVAYDEAIKAEEQARIDRVAALKQTNDARILASKREQLAALKEELGEP